MGAEATPSDTPSEPPPVDPQVEDQPSSQVVAQGASGRTTDELERAEVMAMAGNDINVMNMATEHDDQGEGGDAHGNKIEEMESEGDPPVELTGDQEEEKNHESATATEGNSSDPKDVDASEPPGSDEERGAEGAGGELTMLGRANLSVF